MGGMLSRDEVADKHVDCRLTIVECRLKGALVDIRHFQGRAWANKFAHATLMGCTTGMLSNAATTDYDEGDKARPV